MITKLPRWVWFGGALLAFIAGMVNVIGLLGFEHQPVTHLTATVSRISVAAVGSDLGTLVMLCCIAGAFFGGAVLSGVLIRGVALQLGRHYGVALMIESMLLFAAVTLLRGEQTVGVLFLCAAMGLQNGMVSSFSGAIVRTTHMTGLFTDLGVVIGHALRGTTPDWRRASLCVALIGGFFAGGIMAAIVYPSLGYAALFIPAAMTGITAAWYWRFEKRRLAATASGGA